MNPETKRRILDAYQRAKEKGVSFFPEVVFKDAVVALAIFLLLIALSYFVGAPLEERADPADTNYTPRPEWYFLFLFQLLKYFPGRLEVIGVFVLPTLAVLLLLLLPWLDRSPQRHLRRRPVVAVVAAAGVIGVGLLTALAVVEAPPPRPEVAGDPTAALYSTNCAGCHGPQISVAAGTNLHEVIAQGRHEGMPAWSADLTSDQIDALAGFILSPAGSQLFFNNCGSCHQAPELVAGDPLELRRVLEEAGAYPPHAEVEVPDWGQTLSGEERSALLNFLAAPDGQRLFATDCSPCHGRAIAFGGDEAELRQIIARGGLHLEMPPWREQLDDQELETLARYVVDPQAAPAGADLFGATCSACHGQRVPSSPDAALARQIIAGGGAHQTMPVWGEVLTAEQLEALTRYSLQVARGAPQELGGELYAQNCAVCHGDFGEGGPNPARADDIIAPISTAEYLKTRDDATLRAIIAQGQPNFGMSPFGTTYGGPLGEDEIDAVVAFLRAWQASPPVELPPEVTVRSTSVSAADIYGDICQQCHGPAGEGGVGPSFQTTAFRARSDQEVFDTINLGHEATAMIGWGDLLSADQIRDLVAHLRRLASPGAAMPSGGDVSFARDLVPILQASCAACHGTLGGWAASSYDQVVTSGASGPAVIPGEPGASLLAHKLLGTQAVGAIMPPSGALPAEQVQLFLEWISAGAPDN
jgi:mono/diheme cytochrome c family protein